MISFTSFLRTSIFSGGFSRLNTGVLLLVNRQRTFKKHTSIQIRMGNTDASGKSDGVTSSLKPDSKLEQIIHENASDGWEKSWELGVTPWDLGRPTPILMHLHQTGILPKGRALIPGCGSGYDVDAISCAERFVVGLDISENCIKRAMKDLSMSLLLEACISYIMLLWISTFDTRFTSCPFILLMQLHSSSLGAENFEFVKADFFTWKPTELFDLIFDYTFLCAIEPCMRLAWAKKIDEFLKPDGELITLMFPISDHDGGPPYKVSVSDYENVLSPLGFEAVYIEDNEMAIGARKGREKLGRWKRSKSRALL